MNFEHQARIIGMGLLLGDIPFQAVVQELEALRTGGGEGDLEALLKGLQNKGILTEESCLALQAQVSDLERLMQAAPSSSDASEPTLDEDEPHPTAVISLPPEGERSHQTASWTPPYHTRPRGTLGRTLLSALTLPRWNKFINLRFVGEGGMGRIFRAFDPELNRPVALKFLRWVNHEGVSDLVREARSQAQVDHPNICKVYEVKEWHGQVYLVMQFIEGQTLDQVAPLMSLPQKTELMEHVADAVHAAHRQGLIHRDLKPTNIMVQPGSDGTFTPFVLDFGLARDAGNSRQTRQGSIQGTAHYMAPEQARGDTELIERRTDVYALGVTLYEIFTGAPPFAEIEGLDCLRYIVEETPPPLRARNPELPADLQTIVMKCLEKDISQRYESARALGEDLRRFRDSEPILARPSSLGYRLGKYARKNKALVSLGAAALMAVLVLIGFGVQARVSAASQAHWAQHYGQEAERIEALLRYVRLQPPHDIRAELELVRARIHSLESGLREVRALAQGPGHYALGRAYLALGEPERALQSLDRAWNSDFRTPDMAYARGRAMGQLYAQSLDDARAVQDERLRHARLQELEETLRAPAVALLRQGQRSLLDPPGFQEALLAFYDQRFEVSLRMTQAASKSAPWFYEARRLESEIRLEQARLEQDPLRALDFLAQAGTALNGAATTAPSDPALWDLISRRWWEEMILLRRGGKPTRESQRRQLEACEQWQRLVPDSPAPESRLARGELEAAKTPGHGTESPAALAQALARCERLLAQHPDDPDALGTLASGLQLRAYRDLNVGKDPRSDLKRAIALLHRVFEARPAAFECFEPFVACHWALVEYEKSRGRNPASQVERALPTVQELARRYPRIADFQGFLGGLQVELADFQALHGIDPEPVAQRALHHLDQATRMAPARFEFPFSRGNALLALAQYQLLNGLDAEATLAAADAAYRTSLARNSSAEGALLGLGEIALLRAQALDTKRRSPLPILTQAERELAHLASPRGNWRVCLFSAQANRMRARWSEPVALKRSLLTEAEQDAERALSLSGRSLPGLLVLAQIQRDWAELIPDRASARRKRAKQLLKEVLNQDSTFEPARQLEASGY